MPRRVVILCKLDRAIGEVAAAPVNLDAFHPCPHPGAELAHRIAAAFRVDRVQGQFRLGRGGAEAGHHEVVLRSEIAVEGHLVRAGSLGDGIDANAAHPVLAEQFACGPHDPVAWPCLPLDAVRHAEPPRAGLMGLFFTVP